MKKKTIGIIFIGFICSFFLTASSVFAVESVKQGKMGIKASAQSIKPAKPAPSEVVTSVQEALNKEGFKLKVDGLMGKHTLAALKTYQKKNGLQVTGKPDKATLDKLAIK